MPFAFAMFQGDVITISSGGVVNSWTDDFNRANSATLDSNWTFSGSNQLFHISNSAVYMENGSNYQEDVQYWNANIPNSNQYAQVKLLFSGTSANYHAYPGLIVRGHGQNAYMVYVGSEGTSDTTELGKWTNGTYSALTTSSIAVSSGDVVRLEAVDSNIAWYINGVLQESVTDTSFTTGSTGLYVVTFSSTTGIRLDDFEGGNITSSYKLVASDNFNRSDQTPLAGNWTNMGADTQYNLSSNSVSLQATGGYGFMRWNANSFNDNQYAKATIKELSSVNGQWTGVSVRATGTSATACCYYIQTGHTTTSEFGMLVNGAQTIWSATGSAVVANDVVKLTVSGSTISWYINDVFQASATDTDLTSGSCGICGYQYGGTDKLDDWQAGNL